MPLTALQLDYIAAMDSPISYVEADIKYHRRAFHKLRVKPFRTQPETDAMYYHAAALSRLQRRLDYHRHVMRGHS